MIVKDAINREKLIHLYCPVCCIGWEDLTAVEHAPKKGVSISQHYLQRITVRKK